MEFRITRRDFITRASNVFIASGFLCQTRCVSTRKISGGSPWTDLPPLDGTLSFGDIARSPMAVDLGNHYFRMPSAVLQPRSVNDIVGIVRHANRHTLNVTMRGQGHSQYGQTLAEGGIIIDSRGFNAIKLIENDWVDVQAGASWDDVTRATLAQDLSPPAMGDSMSLSVGGILSAGGISNSSHLYGAVVDTVHELDVVTGSGELITCSPQKNSRLFDIVLAGMGQCALITRARIRLVSVPKCVVRCNFDYRNLNDFLSDYLRLSKDRKYEHLGAYVLPRKAGDDWRFRINIGKFCASPEEYDPERVMSETKATSHDEPTSTTFAGYLHREQKRDEALKERLKGMPTHLLFCAFFLPESASLEFISSVLSSPAETSDMLRFSLYVLPNDIFTRPMFILPKEQSSLCVFLFHSVPASDKVRYSFMVDTLKNLSARIQSASGKLYPPYAPFFTRTDWAKHYGEEQWSELLAAKKRYDPNGTLTPGMETFGGISLTNK